MTTVDRTIASIGLPRHASPKALAESSHRVGDRLHNRGDAAIHLASLLAAKGYPTSTGSDGGPRSTDPTSSTERAAQRAIEWKDRWEGVDHRLATALSDLDRANTKADALIMEILQHAEDLDPVPVGTGECQACGRFCRPDKAKPGNRLRAGLCPTDYRAWLRASKPHRGDWVRTRRGEFTDDNGVLHTPEPDHDIDLTSEALSP